MNIYNFRDYKEYLKSIIEKENSSFTRKLCEAAQLHRSYFSQMINGAPHLTLEHAYRIAAFLGITVDERTFFITLVQHNKAGTIELKEYFKYQLNSIKQQKADISSNLETKNKTDEKQNAIYFSSWRYAFIHTFLYIDPRHGVNTPEKISEKIKLPKGIVLKTLYTLQDMGLAEERDNKWYAHKGGLHLDYTSHYLGKHHANFRLYSANRSLNSDVDDRFFSSIYTMSEEDFKTLKENIVAYILQEVQTTVKPSPADIPVVLNLDMFKI